MASNRVWRNRNNKLVILDTNAILMCFEYSIDLDNEILNLVGKCKIIIPKPVYDEINILAKKGRENKKNKAIGSLKLIKNYKIISFECNLSVDEAVLYYAKKLDAYVVTNDIELRKKLKIESIPVIYLRGKQRLILD